MLKTTKISSHIHVALMKIRSFDYINDPELTCNPDPDSEYDEAEHQEYDSSGPGELRSYTRYLPVTNNQCVSLKL